jgi:CubicO group peptidase (beta-lactamase class C family)
MSTMKHSLLLLVVTTLTSTIVFAQDKHEAADAALQEIARQGFVGSVLVARDSDIEYAGDFGFLEELTSTPSYWIASITKQFVATGILLLHERGELDINEPVSAYLEGVPDDKAGITLFQLLTHTSGVAQNYAADGIADRSDALQALLAAELQSEPGKTFSYANDNYNILAIVLEIVSGQSYETFMHEQVFMPAGMRETASWGSPISSTSFVPPVVTPMAPAAMQRNWGFRGATGMRASVPDLFSFLQSLEAGVLLSEQSLVLLQGNHIQTAGGTEIGFNWFGRRLDNGYYARFSRGQESFGGNAVIYIYPERGLTIITATNAGPAETGDGPVTGWSRVTHEALAEIFLAD